MPSLRARAVMPLLLLRSRQAVPQRAHPRLLLLLLLTAARETMTTRAARKRLKSRKGGRRKRASRLARIELD
jgi:hypothetical protein